MPPTQTTSLRRRLSELHGELKVVLDEIGDLARSHGLEDTELLVDVMMPLTRLLRKTMDARE